LNYTRARTVVYRAGAGRVTVEEVDA